MGACVRVGVCVGGWVCRGVCGLWVCGCVPSLFFVCVCSVCVVCSVFCLFYVLRVWVCVCVCLCVSLRAPSLVLVEFETNAKPPFWGVDRYPNATGPGVNLNRAPLALFRSLFAKVARVHRQSPTKIQMLPMACPCLARSYQANPKKVLHGSTPCPSTFRTNPKSARRNRSRRLGRSRCTRRAPAPLRERNPNPKCWDFPQRTYVSGGRPWSGPKRHGSGQVGARDTARQGNEPDGPAEKLPKPPRRSARSKVPQTENSPRRNTLRATQRMTKQRQRQSSREQLILGMAGHETIQGRAMGGSAKMCDTSTAT